MRDGFNGGSTIMVSKRDEHCNTASLIEMNAIRDDLLWHTALDLSVYGV